MGTLTAHCQQKHSAISHQDPYIATNCNNLQLNHKAKDTRRLLCTSHLSCSAAYLKQFVISTFIRAQMFDKSSLNQPYTHLVANQTAIGLACIATNLMQHTSSKPKTKLQHQYQSNHLVFYFSCLRFILTCFIFYNVFVFAHFLFLAKVLFFVSKICQQA